MVLAKKLGQKSVLTWFRFWLTKVQPSNGYGHNQPSAETAQRRSCADHTVPRYHYPACCMTITLTMSDYGLSKSTLCIRDCSSLQSLQHRPPSMHDKLMGSSWQPGANSSHQQRRRTCTIWTGTDWLVGNRTLRRDFSSISPLKIWAQKLPIFDDFATRWQLWCPISLTRNSI